MIRAQALWYERAANAEGMEALAVRDAVRLALERAIQHVHI